VVHRHELRPTLARLCRILMKSPAIQPAAPPKPEVSDTAPADAAPAAPSA